MLIIWQWPGCAFRADNGAVDALDLPLDAAPPSPARSHLPVQRRLWIAIVSCNGIASAPEATRFQIWWRLKRRIDAADIELFVHTSKPLGLQTLELVVLAASVMSSDDLDGGWVARVQTDPESSRLPEARFDCSRPLDVAGRRPEGGAGGAGRAARARVLGGPRA
jgi:hypothetical protein